MITKELYNSPETVSFTSPLPSEMFFSNISKQAKIIDLGCGYGRVLKFLFEEGYRNLYGIDSSSKLIERAKTYFPNADYSISSILELDTSTKFDCVLLCGVLEYFYSDDERSSITNIAFDLLSENGFVFIEGFLLDNNYLKDYFVNFVKGDSWGTVYSENARLRHTTSKKIDNLFSSKFRKVVSAKSDFKTWTNKNRNGYIALYQKRVSK
ncbi:MAG: class I SAM-dependent methyltransferase [Bacteroidetes bacterium]|nr:class I SAM-dependent methyltransferase [Bacteroidota bacterium]